MKVALINPNTSHQTTEMMVGIAAKAAGDRTLIEGITAPRGTDLITTPSALRYAADTVATMAPKLGWADAVIIAAFGDPGLFTLRQKLDVPVTGIAEAGMVEAGQAGRRFAVVTTTPALHSEIAAMAIQYKSNGFAGTWVTAGDPGRLTNDPLALHAALKTAISTAVLEGNVNAVLIGGGPLARAARALAADAPVPVLDPVSAAIRLSIDRASERRSP